MTGGCFYWHRRKPLSGRKQSTQKFTLMKPTGNELLSPSVRTNRGLSFLFDRAIMKKRLALEEQYEKAVIGYG
jgi:hypothetical protein